MKARPRRDESANELIVLRQWTDADLEPYARMNSDPDVMRYFPAPLTLEQSRESMRKIQAAIDERGWGLWVVDVDGQFAGFTGLNVPAYETAFTPCVEIGWRLAREYWGRGIAYRAALQALEFGFDSLQLGEIVSFTAAGNTRSRRLMERLRFRRNPAEDFDHPLIEEGHPLRRHALYRNGIVRKGWSARA